MEPPVSQRLAYQRLVNDLAERTTPSREDAQSSRVSPSSLSQDVESDLDPKVNHMVAAQLTKTKMCAMFARGECQDPQCRFAHSAFELRTAPNLMKTKICFAFTTGLCADAHCRFAHGEEDLRSTSEVYKTQICNFHERGHCRKGNQCRHAHGIEELRAFPVSGKAAGAQHESDRHSNARGRGGGRAKNRAHGGGGGPTAPRTPTTPPSASVPLSVYDALAVQPQPQPQPQHSLSFVEDATARRGMLPLGPDGTLPPAPPFPFGGGDLFVNNARPGLSQAWGNSSPNAVAAFTTDKFVPMPSQHQQAAARAMICNQQQGIDGFQQHLQPVKIPLSHDIPHSNPSIVDPRYRQIPGVPEAAEDFITMVEQAQAYQQIAEGYARLAKMKLAKDRCVSP
jgi:hypothetical protein